MSKLSEEQKAIENIEKELNKKYEPIPTYKYSLYENGSSNSPYVIPTKYFNERDIRTVLNLISNLQKELDKKDKVIDLMAEHLTTPVHSKEWVIKYFEEKVK